MYLAKAKKIEEMCIKVIKNVDTKNERVLA